MFAHLPYVSLENLDTREYARNDPRGFLEQYRKGALTLLPFSISELDAAGVAPTSPDERDSF